MAGSVNKVILIGNLGRDPDVRSFQNGGRVCTLSLATSETWRDKATGERKERTEWHRVVIFNENLLKVAEQYLKKGSKVYIEGQIETRKATDQAGGERYFTEVVLRPYRGELTILDSAGARSGPSPDEYGTTRSRDDDYGAAREGRAPAGGTGRMGNDLDDDIPF